MKKSLILLLVLGGLAAWQFSDILAPRASGKVRMVHRAPMEDVGFERSEALTQLNTIRETMGMPRMHENTALRTAAQAHADYLVRHRLSSHREQANRKGFAGAKPMDRALRAGYHSRFVGENLSTNNVDASHSIDGLFSAIYHRFGFLKLAFDEVGIGITQDKHNPENSAFVYLMGNSEINRLCTEKSFKGRGKYVYGVCADTQHRIQARVHTRARDEIKERNPKIVVYPYDGQQDVPPAFFDEHPDPLPQHEVSGFPVSVEFNDRYFRRVELLTFRLYRKGGKEVKAVRLLTKSTDPNQQLSRRQFALLPLKRLAWGATYRAEVVYRHKRKRHTLGWSFSTRAPTEAIRVIRAKETTLTLKSGKGYWLYFPPTDPHDLLHTMRYPEDLYVRFIDNNTMRIVLDLERTRGFTIEGSGRKIHIEVE